MSKRKFVYFWKYVFLILVAIISIFPMYWMIVSGTNKSVDVIVGKILPGNYLMENLKSLLDTTVLSQAMWNSIRNAVVSMVLNVFVCSLAGYGFEKFHDKYKDKIMSILLLSMMVPTAATVIPLFRMFGKMGLLNTTVGCILPTVSTAFMIFMFRQAAKSFPDEIIEATKIIFGATQVVYSERRDVPATIFLSISAPFSDMVMSILGTHDLIVRPAGVKVRVDCSTEDAETFGFVDLNPRVAGFGEGMFAQSIN